MSSGTTQTIKLGMAPRHHWESPPNQTQKKRLQRGLTQTYHPLSGQFQMQRSWGRRGPISEAVLGGGWRRCGGRCTLAPHYSESLESSRRGSQNRSKSHSLRNKNAVYFLCTKKFNHFLEAVKIPCQESAAFIQSGKKTPCTRSFLAQ